MPNSTLATLCSRLARSRLRIGSICRVPISLHWSWLPAVILWALWNARPYSTWLWAVAETIAVFLIVLLHELGHALIARWNGQTAREIVLWPLGGLAIADPPRRWRTEFLFAAAGPAVNLLLVPVTGLLWYQFGHNRGDNISLLLRAIVAANLGILLFNLAPIWPLDGGRIFHAVLSRYGPARSRLASGILGAVCAAAGIVLFSLGHNVIAVTLLSSLLLVSVMSAHWASTMLRSERAYGFHELAVCPHCHSRALRCPTGRCRQCGEYGDLFLTEGRCWNCGSAEDHVSCSYCGESSSIADWRAEAEHADQQLPVARLSSTSASVSGEGHDAG